MKLERQVNGHMLTLESKEIGEDLLVTVFGGDQHHIGGVAIAYPTKSHYRESTTVSMSTLSFPGHKDYVVANTAAEKIAKNLIRSCVVTVGIHVDNASRELIDDIVSTLDEMVDELISYYKS